MEGHVHMCTHTHTHIHITIYSSRKQSAEGEKIGKTNVCPEHQTWTQEQCTKHQAITLGKSLLPILPCVLPAVVG